MKIGILWPLLATYTTCSVITFVAYAMDKSAARKGNGRISENTLHLLSLLWGWPGAWAAQQILRHKSSKRSFRRVYWLTVLLNIGMVSYLVFFL
tara:strand:+ start:246034 stop:246315 length:282 start_codon:yes stop_codon:yes gene_type:complete